VLRERGGGPDPQEVKTVSVTMIETNCALRHLRPVRDKMYRDLMLMEEQIRAGNDGTLKDAHRSLDTEIVIIDNLLRKLWETYLTYK